MSSTVVVGLSGGVDSSIAAYLLKREGYRVIGVFMKNWEHDDNDQYCSSRQDWLDALAVADRLGIEIEAVNFSQDYQERVFSEFLSEYAAGRTPNPDVLCNAEIKFHAFLQYAQGLGANHLATGHYAKVSPDPAQQTLARVRLLRAQDATKDQSYFLYRLQQHQLQPALFPLAHLKKDEVRALAHQLQLNTANKKDSTGICFIGERPFREFLQRYLANQPGPIENEHGHVIGQHIGLSFYTLGQRKGIGIGGQKKFDSAPWFVAQKNIARNALIVVQGHEHPLLYHRHITLTRCNWIAGNAPRTIAGLSAKTRYRQIDAPLEVLNATNESATLSFNHPQWAVTPGQSCVIYQGQECLGGGIIDQIQS